MANVLIHSVAEFINEVQRVAPDSRIGKLALFRGQSDATWPLVPGIARSPFDPKMSISTNPTSAGDKSAERRLLLLFNDHGLPCFPKWVWQGTECEVKWKQVLVAQHYRLPTRLLDWTANPLVALYFAVAGDRLRCNHDASSACEARDDVGFHYAAVYALLDRDTFGVFSLAKNNDQPPLYRSKHDPGVIRPPAIDKRITSQNSLFTISSEPEKPIAADVTILVDGTKRDTILFELNQLNVNRMILFPDLEGISTYLRWDVPHWHLNPGCV